MDIKCNFCGADVTAGDSFCQKCGKPVTASSNLIKCNSCGADVKLGDAFCQKCGKSVTAVQVNNQPVNNQPASNEAPTTVTVYVEPKVAFASGLPAWNIEPPAVVIRRKARI